MNIEEISTNIKEKFELEDTNGNKKYIVAMYAFNGTGKTRISNEFDLLNEELSNDELEKINIDELKEKGIPEPTKKVLCYNAFLEDLFSWDNDNNILKFNNNSWEAELIQYEGLDGQIINNFKDFLNTKTEPSFSTDFSEIIFNISSGDNESNSNIKISRGEESIFIWAVFYTILEFVISELNTKKENRSNHYFDDLEYIIIDDPVSSIDDTKIITLGIELVKLIKTDNENKIKFLITTHHPLFYNVFINSFKRNKIHSLILKKISSGLELKGQGDSPFGYHLLVKDEIKKAIEDGYIQKYHFNLFRGLLEKTANFLGFNYWGVFFKEDDGERIIKILDQYSHNKISDIEYKEVTDEDKVLFTEKFNNFITEYKWKV